MYALGSPGWGTLRFRERWLEDHCSARLISLWGLGAFGRGGSRRGRRSYRESQEPGVRLKFVGSVAGETC